MGKLDTLRRSSLGLTIPDFRKVVERLRLLAQTMYETGAPAEALISSAGAMFTAEDEWATQAVLALYDHLAHYEQWRAAAYLMAYCVPNRVFKDPRIQEIVEHCRGVAEMSADPDTERAGYYLDALQALGDAFQMTADITPRAAFMLHAAELSRSKKVLEFATGGGTNIFTAARLNPDIAWRGMDISKRQMAYCQDQALRVGLPVQFMAHPCTEWLGSFDAVAVLDTLEHTAFPYELLESAEQYVKPGGLVIVSVPNGPWSPFTPNKKNISVAPGQHIATEIAPTLGAMLSSRGKVIHVRMAPGSNPAEMNSTLGCVYEPWEDRK